MSDNDRFKQIMNEADSLLGKFPEKEKEEPKKKPEKKPEKKPLTPQMRPVGNVLWDFFTKPFKKESQKFDNPAYGLPELNRKPEEIGDYVSEVQRENALVDQPTSEVPMPSGDDDVE